MNSLSWLLAPRPRPSKSSSSLPSSATASSSNLRSTNTINRTKSSSDIVDLGTGPREREAEWVDKMVDRVERQIGTEAANRLERKASMGLDGQLRFGLPGINERRRTIHLETSSSSLLLASTERSSSLSSLNKLSITNPDILDTSSTSSSSSTTESIVDNSDLSSRLIPNQNSSSKNQGDQELFRILRGRLGLKLFLLIRKFLSLFGLRIDNLNLAGNVPNPLTNNSNNNINNNRPPEKHHQPSTNNNNNSNNNSSDSNKLINNLDSRTKFVNFIKSLGLLVNFRWIKKLRMRVTNFKRSLGSSSRQSSQGQGQGQQKKRQMVFKRNKTLVLDLDETLIHSTSRLGGLGGSSSKKSNVNGHHLNLQNSNLNGSSSSVNGLKARVVEVVLDGRIVVYHVYKRPWVDFFLKTVSSWYTVVIFTASMREYADPVIDWLDQGRGLIDGRLFRESCTNIKGSYVKDLSIVEKDLSKVCLVDNSPSSYELNQANGIPIEGWLNDPKDEGLLELLPMLDSLRFTNDVRRVLGLRGFGMKSVLINESDKVAISKPLNKKKNSKPSSSSFKSDLINRVEDFDRVDQSNKEEEKNEDEGEEDDERSKKFKKKKNFINGHRNDSNISFNNKKSH